MAEAPPASRAGALLASLLALAALAGCRPEPAPVAFHAQGQPATLAEWNLFATVDGELVANAGVETYELNTPLFSDYAHKLRTVWMPAGQAAQYRDGDVLDFPVGTILSKTFYYPRLPGEATGSARVRRSDDDPGERAGGRLALDAVRLVETRLLVRRGEGWVAMAYVWNEAQTEARLMRSGALVPLQLVADDGSAVAATYAVPDQNQCAGCHVADVRSRRLAPLGPTARNLDRPVPDPTGQDGDQLRRWQAAGRLDGLPAAAMPRLADWRDESEPLDRRARAYLEVNCAHCHSPRGPGNTSGLWLASDVVDPLRLGRCKLPIAAGHGTGDRRFGIVPGEPDASILAFRLESTDPGVLMPELGRSVVHAEGVALIRAWIAAQDGSCGSPERQEDQPTGERQ